MSFVLLILLVSAAAVLTTVALCVGLRVTGAIGARRVGRYRAQVRDHVRAYVAGGRDDAPPRPQSTFQRRVMRQDLVALAPNVKGDARERLASLFRDYGLAALAHDDLRHRDLLTRVRAAEAIGAMGDATDVPALRAALSQHDGLVQLAGARALAELRAVDELPSIMVALTASSAEPGEVAEILLTFGALAVPFLRERVADIDAPGAERRLAAAALGEIRALDAAPELRAALHDPDEEIVARAARALGQAGDTSAREPLVGLLADPARPFFVHVAAAGALGALDDPAAAPALVRTLADEDWDVRNAASRALAALGEAGIAAAADQLDSIPDPGLAHFLGTLDVEDRLGALITRAAAGDDRLQRLVSRGAAAGVRARVDELAA